MKTLITYSTTHGCTQKTVHILQDFLGPNAQSINLKDDPNPDISEFDRVIIGGSIHAGRIQKRVKQFYSKNFELLQARELGLFICCMEEGEKAQIQFNDAYPEELRRNAKAIACFGGEFDFNKMSAFQRMIIRKIAKTENNSSKIDKEAIHNFSKKMDKVFNPFLFLV